MRGPRNQRPTPQLIKNVLERTMFRKCVVAAVLAAGAAFLPGAASAETGFTVESTELRAGPDYDYPTVRIVRGGRNLEIFGCLRDWSWCDVGYRSDRGWVDGRDIAVDYRGRRQGISNVAPYLGIGVLSFSFGNYWDNNYRGRPFYSERNRWERHYYDHHKSHWGPRPDRRDWDNRNRRDGRDGNDRDRRDNDRSDNDRRDNDRRDNDRRDNDRARGNDNDRARERAEEARRNAEERAREVQQRTAPVTTPKPQAQPQPGLHQRGIERKDPTPDRTPTPAASERRNDRPGIEERRAARPDAQQRPQVERPTAAPQQREAKPEREERKPRARPATPDQDEDNRPGR
jgi:uncharacterized protein YraI